MFTKILLVGSGGHAKVVVDAIRTLSPKIDIVLADENIKVIGQKMFGEISVVALDAGLEYPKNVHISIGSNEARTRQYLKVIGIGRKLVTIIHPSAYVALGAQIGNGCFIAANAIISSETNLGRGCIVNHAAIVDHDCKIGDFSHMAPNVTLGGGVKIGEKCLIGAGAVVLPGIIVGDNVVVGAGAVVTKNILANNTVVGIPARHVDK